MRKCVNQSYWNAKNSDFLVELLKKAAVYCLVHKNKLAGFLDANAMDTMCDACNSRFHGDKVCLDDADFRVSEKLDEIFYKKRTDAQFFHNLDSLTPDIFIKFTNQEKIDYIRAGLKPARQNSLRSFLPKGRKFEETLMQNYSVLYRFCSLYPPS